MDEAGKRPEQLSAGLDADGSLPRCGHLQPVVLTAQALRAVEGSCETDATCVLRDLQRCADQLLAWRERIPDAARRRFDALHDLIQDVCRRLPADAEALAVARPALVEHITALGDVLLALLLGEAGPATVPVIPA